MALQDFSMAMASVVQRKVMIKRFSWEIMGYLLIDRIFGRKNFLVIKVRYMVHYKLSVE